MVMSWAGPPLNLGFILDQRTPAPVSTRVCGSALGVRGAHVNSFSGHLSSLFSPVHICANLGTWRASLFSDAIPCKGMVGAASWK